MAGRQPANPLSVPEVTACKPSSRWLRLGRWARSNICAIYVPIVCTNDARTDMSAAAVVDELAPGASFDQFMDLLRDPELPAPVLSARRFGEALHIDLQTLAKQAHVHRNTLSRMPASQSGQRF